MIEWIMSLDTFDWLVIIFVFSCFISTNVFEALGYTVVLGSIYLIYIG